MHDLAAAQEDVTKANTNALALFLAIGLATHQDDAKRKAALDAYCTPEQLRALDDSLAAISAASAAAKRATKICPAGEDVDKVKALHRQYGQLKKGAVKMQESVTQTCDAGRR